MSLLIPTQPPTQPMTYTIDPWTFWVNSQASTTGMLQWNNWIQPSSSAQTFTVPPVWYSWQNAWPQFAQTAPPPVLGQMPQLTAEQLVEQQRAAERNRLIRDNRTRARTLRLKLAERTAEALLLECLDGKQAAEWKEKKGFHVETANGRVYWIARGCAGNIRLVSPGPVAPVSKHGRVIMPGARFCAHAYHPDEYLPAEDHVLAQKLLLDSDEAQFLAMANVS